MSKNQKRFFLLGFTMIEMLLVIAIMAVLSATVIISVSSQREKAMASRALGNLSSLTQPILMCKADGGTINAPANAGGNPICSISSNYGSWPLTSSLGSFTNYASSFNTSNWFFSLASRELKICCSSKSLSCFEMPVATACNANSIP